MRTTRLDERPKPFPFRQRKGIACVEFAVVLPVLIVIIVGMVEVGNALRASHALESALREGGRLAIVSAPTASNDDTLNTKVTQDVRAFVFAAGFSGRNVNVTIEDTQTGAPVTLGDSSLQGTMIRIKASLPYDTIEVFPRQFLSVDSVSNSIVIRIPEQ